jgi:omega-6 fatty acid desaturase (delta-12 desaturase)
LKLKAKTIERKKKQKPEWVDIVAPYSHSDARKSMWQFGSTFTLLIGSWAAMFWALEAGFWWLTLILTVPTAGFVIRLFIIQHDCGHGSFFKSQKWNNRLGVFVSVFTLTPYHHWRKRHAIHHATSSNLDERFIGDVPTLTVSEYLEKGLLMRLGYRTFRFPFTLFVLVPFAVFFIGHRLPSKGASKKERKGIFWTNVAVGLLWAALIVAFSWQGFLLVYVPVVWLSAAFGTWLFFVQHQFEDTYWARQPEWDFTLAGLQGSSYYKLPKTLQWFTGNIGFHHIHHLSPRIPNYLLEKCHEENPIFQNIVTLTLRGSLGTMFLSLWDENQKRLISFRELRLNRRTEAAS